MEAVAEPLRPCDALATGGPDAAGMTTTTDHRPPSRSSWRRIPTTVTSAVLLGTALASPAGAADTGGARDIGTFACPQDEITDHFSDTDGNIHRFAIDCVATYGFAEGTGGGAYSPTATVTRGQLATVLYHLLDAADVPMDTTDQGFTDVAGNVHEAHINGIVSARVAHGTTETTFDPQAPVTRGQMAALITGAVVTTGAFMEVGPNAFDDDDGSVHESWIDALAHNGIVEGVATRRFAPGAPVRRDAMASFVMRGVDFALEHGGLRSPFARDLRVAHLTPDQVATSQGGEPDAEGHGEVWTVPQPDVLCFEMRTTDVGSGPDHPERGAYLAEGAPGSVGRILVELPPPSAANAVPVGADAWSGGCVVTDPATVRAVVERPGQLYLGLATWEHEEALRGQLQAAADR